MNLTFLSSKPFQALLAGIIIGTLVFSLLGREDAVSESLVGGTVLPARVWMEYAQEVVRTQPVTPPRSARFYAYVATAYSKTLEETGSVAQASGVVRDIINALTSTSTQSETEVVFKTVSDQTEVTLSAEAQVIKTELLARAEADGANQPWEGVRPQGQEYWVGENPLEPNAKNWQRWIVEDITFDVPQPPEWGSEEQLENLRLVKEAAINRTNEQAAAVNFWGGVPGTEAPAGIWQNVFYTETQDLALTDSEYAYAQMILAQAIADSFLECWTTKYTYWTKRPSMVDESLIGYLEMDNPPFPSYVSGHSTISRTAAGVLGVLFPEKRSLWLMNAAEARDSRLWAGIHFPYDNEQGFILGEKVADRVIERLSLKSVR